MATQIVQPIVTGGIWSVLPINAVRHLANNSHTNIDGETPDGASVSTPILTVPDSIARSGTVYQMGALPAGAVSGTFKVRREHDIGSIPIPPANTPPSVLFANLTVGDPNDEGTVIDSLSESPVFDQAVATYEAAVTFPDGADLWVGIMCNGPAAGGTVCDVYWIALEVDIPPDPIVPVVLFEEEATRTDEVTCCWGSVAGPSIQYEGQFSPDGGTTWCELFPLQDATCFTWDFTDAFTPCAEGFGIDAGATTFHHCSGATRNAANTIVCFSSGTAVSLVGVDPSFNVRSGRVGAWVICVADDGSKSVVQVGHDYATLAEAAAAISLYGCSGGGGKAGSICVENSSGVDFVAGITNLDASGITVTTKAGALPEGSYIIRVRVHDGTSYSAYVESCSFVASVGCA